MAAMPALCRCVAVCAVVVFPRCAAVISVGAPDVLVEVSRPMVAGTDLRHFKGVVHCHGRTSRDSDGTSEGISAACRDRRAAST